MGGVDDYPERRPRPSEQSLLEEGARLAAEFDPRLAEVWLLVFASGLDLEEGRGEQLGWFLRMAYLRGYEDGLCEPQRGALFRRLGLAVPRRARGPAPSMRKGDR